MEASITVSDIIGAIRRRWLLVAVVTALGTALAVAIALRLPPSYTATARLLVESQQIPEQLARSTITATATERIRLIEQRLLSREVLLDVADEFAVFGERSSLSPTEIVERMREATEIEDVALARQNREVTASAVNISFSHRVPAVAARVANEFMTLLLEQNVRQRNRLASGTLEFFNAEVDRLENALSAAEDRLTRFKNDNRRDLPDSLDYRRNEATRLREVRFEREARRIALEERRRVIERQIARGAPDGVVSPERQELDRLRRTLVQQSAIYRDSHPSIVALKARIAALEPQLESADAPRAADAAADAEEAPLTSELDAIDRQIALLTAQLEDDAARLEALEASIERTPELATTLNALEREVQTLQSQYQDAILKRSQAEVGERLEVSQQAERFEVIEQAQTPASPDSPNRPLIAAGGFVASAGLGGALMILLEILTYCIRSPSDLERQTGLRAIVAIPYIRTAREASWRKARIRLTMLAAIIGLPAAIFAVDRFYRPVPLLIDDLLQSAGLG